MCSIVEYATREQAQTAINTLSNQNLMGRLIYVREVRVQRPCIEVALTKQYRIARQSLASLLAVRQRHVAALTVATEAVADTAEAATAVIWAVAWACKVVEDVRSSSPTFVQSSEP